MKVKHNKKRNTAFVYEALIKEATDAIIKNDIEKKNKIIKIIKNYFAPFSDLKRDLDCYRSLYETTGMDEDTSEKLLKEARLSKRMIDPQNLFKQQKKLLRQLLIILFPITKHWLLFFKCSIPHRQKNRSCLRNKCSDT